MNIGLTGGIACGKSTVSSMLQRRGALVVDADKIAREVVEPGSPVLDRVAEAFGPEIILPDGSMNRKRLGEIVFSDAEARQRLNQLLHPAIRATMRERMQQFEQEQPDKLVVVDVPLLFESGLQAMFERTLVVYIPAELQLERLIRRDGLTPEQAEQRIRAQMPIEEKKRLADYVIDNSDSLASTEQQIDAFWRTRGLP